MTENQNPFGTTLPARREEAGALVEVEQQRAIAETQAAMIIAKRFKRDQADAADRILTACTRPGLAESALYQYAKGGTDITGPSIRLAEAMAQNWGNLQFGIRELDQRNGESTVEAFAWDIETNVKQVKVFQVAHKRHTKRGSYALEDPRDIYEMVANQGARRLRACILGVIPGDVVEAAVKQCETTMQTKAEVTPERIRSLVEKFGEYKVTKAQIEKRIQRKVESITPALMVNLGKIYNSLKDGMSAPVDWFEADAEQNDLTEKLKANATNGNGIPAPKKEEPKPAPPAGNGGNGLTPKPETETATSQGAQTQPSNDKKAFDPYTEPLQLRYVADKGKVLIDECKRLGIEFAGLTGRQMHEKILAKRPASGAVSVEKKPEPTTTAAWNPLTEPVQDTYSAEQMNLIEAECTIRLISIAGIGPQEAHALLLDSVKAEKVDLAAGNHHPECRCKDCVAVMSDQAPAADWDENAKQKMIDDPKETKEQADLRLRCIDGLVQIANSNRPLWLKAKQQAGIGTQTKYADAPLDKLVEWYTLAKTLAENPGLQ